MVEVTAAIICKRGRVLICQRPADKRCGLLWEFPGGKLEEGETGEQCIRRECREELAAELAEIRPFAEVVYEYPGYAVHIQFYTARTCATGARRFPLDQARGGRGNRILPRRRKNAVRKPAKQPIPTIKAKERAAWKLQEIKRQKPR